MDFEKFDELYIIIFFYIGTNIQYCDLLDVHTSETNA